jgi:hypothetical protein
MFILPVVLSLSSGEADDGDSAFNLAGVGQVFAASWHCSPCRLL